MKQSRVQESAAAAARGQREASAGGTAEITDTELDAVFGVHRWSSLRIASVQRIFVVFIMIAAALVHTEYSRWAPAGALPWQSQGGRPPPRRLPPRRTWSNGTSKASGRPGAQRVRCAPMDVVTREWLQPSNFREAQTVG